MPRAENRGLNAAIPDFFARLGVHYAWVVIAVAFLCMLATAGAVGGPGAFIAPFKEEFGWSTAEVSTAFALRLSLFGLMGPFAAAFLNHFGLRRVLIAALFLIALGLSGAYLMRSLWQFTLAWGVVVGVGSGLTAVVFGATVATRWFAARRGLALGMLTASNATGQLIFLPILAALIQATGWRSALGFILVLLLAAAVAALVFMRDKPADVGLAPYGAAGEPPPAAAPSSLKALLVLPVATLFEAARTPVFWLLFGTFFICGASTNGLIQTHFIPLCGDFGIAPVAAANLLAVIGAFDIIGTIASGWLSDRYDSRLLLVWYYGLRGLALIYLPLTGFQFIDLSLFAVFYGLDWIATVPPTVKLTVERFGARANIVFGWVFAGHQLGAATAAWSAGYSRTVYDTYLPAFFGAGLLCLVAALALMASRRPRRRAESAEAA